MTGTAYGSNADASLTFSSKVNLKAGINKIALLSAGVGLAVSIYIPDKSTSLFLMPRNLTAVLFWSLYLIDFRILACILINGMSGFLAQSPWAVSIQEHGTCLNGNGPTRLVSSIPAVLFSNITLRNLEFKVTRSVNCSQPK